MRRVEAPWRKFTQRRYKEAQEVLESLQGFAKPQDLDALITATGLLEQASAESRGNKPWWRRVLDYRKDRRLFEIENTSDKEEACVLTAYPSMPSGTNWTVYHPQSLKQGQFWRPIDGHAALIDEGYSFILPCAESGKDESTEIAIGSYTDARDRRRILFNIGKYEDEEEEYMDRKGRIRTKVNTYFATVETRLSANVSHGGIDINVVAYQELGRPATHYFRLKPGTDTNDVVYQKVDLADQAQVQGK